MSQFTPIGEAIEVAGSYLKNKSFKPARFRWQNCTFDITEITFVANAKDGGVAKRLYSVMASNSSKKPSTNQALYRLEFNLFTEQWQVLEIWNE
jgi:hypothetical protein